MIRTLFHFVAIVVVIVFISFTGEHLIYFIEMLYVTDAKMKRIICLSVLDFFMLVCMNAQVYERSTMRRKSSRKRMSK